MLVNWHDPDHIYLVCGKTDMRKGIDGLAMVIAENYGLELYNNSLFLFSFPAFFYLQCKSRIRQSSPVVPFLWCKVTMWVNRMIFLSIDCRKNGVTKHYSPPDAVKPKPPTDGIHGCIHFLLLFQWLFPSRFPEAISDHPWYF